MSQNSNMQRSNRCVRLFSELERHHNTLPFHNPTMPLSQDDLRKLWHTSAPERLTPWQQAFALGLREASKEMYNGHVCVTWIASKLRKTDSSGEAYSELSPEPCSVSLFFKKVDEVDDWFPGKHNGGKRGPKPILTKAKRARIASCSMAQKAEGDEPCIEVTIQRCPKATMNTKTKRPFCDKTIRKVWLQDCFDFTEEFPWKYQTALQKKFLPDPVMAHRLSMVNVIEAFPNCGDNDGWWYRHIIWMDPCSSLIPRTRKQYDRMRRAQTNNQKRLISDDARMYNRNPGGRQETLKQATYEVEKVNWLMVLARGKVSVHALPEDWAVNGEGMAVAVNALPQILRRSLGKDAQLPRVLFTDRGTGMHAPSGRIVKAFNNAIKASGFRTFWGEGAAKQSPDMGDLLLHETAVSWFRSQMRREKPIKLPWEETREEWIARANVCVRRINAKYDGDGLCHRFLTRLRDCKNLDGGRLRK